MSDEITVLTRRDFVRGTVAGALAASLPAHALQQKRGPRSSTVVLVRNQKALGAGNSVDVAVLKQMLTDTVMRVTKASSERDAWRSLFKPQDIVGLVPTPHLNPTHKELIEAVRTALQEAGIPPGNLRSAQGGPDEAKACTSLIALPALKAHWLTGLGTVLKNYITYSGSPSSYHDQDNAKLGEIWNMPHVKGKTRLVLVDALRPLCDKGPQPDPRYMWNYCGLIAGTDPVAVETVCLKIIEEKRRAIRGEPWPLSPPPLCVAAADLTSNLGTSKLSEIKIERAGWEQEPLI
jgi:hypothetical protein